MTISITEVFPDGVVMIADSAESHEIIGPEASYKYTVFTRVHNLQVIKSLDSGMSLWTKSSAPPENRIDHLWLTHFIERHGAGCSSLSDFAILLQNELRRCIAPIDVKDYPSGTLGLHLAGYVNFNGKSTPTFYHIHNGMSRALASRGIEINPSIVNANHDLPPNIVQEYFSKGMSILYRNGDWVSSCPSSFGGASELSENSLQRNDPKTANSSDSEQFEFLPFRLETMFDRNRLNLKHLPPIGRKIDTILITAKGVDARGINL